MNNVNKLKEEQIKLAKKISLTDQFEKIEKIAGVDYVYTEKHIICAVVILDYKTLKTIERKYAIEEQSFPYIPGFLSYRVTPVTIKAFEKIENKPDLLIVSASGIMHPRRIGAASAVGLFLDLPTIGITNKNLCGKDIEGGIYMDKEFLGKKIETKDKAKPIYVSQGHRIGIKTT